MTLSWDVDYNQKNHHNKPTKIQIKLKPIFKQINTKFLQNQNQILQKLNQI